jgi:hypothetical protein
MKIKLLRVSGRALGKLRQFGETLLQDGYEDEKEVGFSISQISDTLICGRFLEKKTRKFQVTDANGEVKPVEVDSINIIRFTLNAKLGFLVIEEFHGSVAPFIARLGLLSGFQITIEVAEISLNSFITFFENKAYALRVSEVTASHVRVSNDVEATIRLRGNVALAVATTGLFMERKGDVVSAHLHCTSNDEDFVFMWKNSGNHEITPTPSDNRFVLSMIEFLSQIK